MIKIQTLMLSSKPIALLVITAISALAITGILTHRAYFAISLQDQQSIEIHTPKIQLRADQIQPFLFGFSPLVADLIWMYTNVEMDVSLRDQNDYNLHYTLVHLMTDLDPHFEPLYFYSAYKFTYATQGTDKHMQGVDDAQEILHKGWDYYIHRNYDWQHYDRYWLIPQMIGFHYYFEYQDKEKALPYFEYIANHVPQAPHLYRTFASHIHKELNQEEAMLSVLENIIVQELLTDQMSLTDNAFIKERVRERMIHLQGGLEVKDKIDAYIASLKKQTQTIIDLWLRHYPYLTLPQFLSIHAHTYQEKIGHDLDMVEVLFYQAKGL